MQAQFITIEGTEGAGKSTNLEFIKRFLESRSIPYLCTREPGGTPLAETLRDILLAPREEAVVEETELLLMFAARAQHLKTVILPALERGEWVLCDRFTDATYAYQSGGRGVDCECVRQLENLVQGTLRPDYTILLDVPVSIGMERARGRGELDRIERENLEFFERVRASYLDLAEKGSGRYRLVDAGQSLEQVQEEVLRIGRELLSCRDTHGGSRQCS